MEVNNISEPRWLIQPGRVVHFCEEELVLNCLRLKQSHANYGYPARDSILGTVHDSSLLKPCGCSWLFRSIQSGHRQYQYVEGTTSESMAKQSQ